MSTKEYNFNEVSLLITHYNRPGSLKRLLQHFNDLNCKFGEVVVSDDCSKAPNLEEVMQLQREFGFVLKTTPKNKGLGNNINKGQDAVTKGLTLYVQEDFVPKAAFPEKLNEAISFMEQDAGLDVVRFYAYQLFPYLKPFGKGFSLMQFNAANVFGSYKKFYVYSDHPHLRRSSFLQKFGRYPEGVNVEKAEYGMMMSFLKHKGKGLFFEKFNDLFDQMNSAEEPSTFERNWKRRDGFFIGIVRHLYRHVKFNLSYLFK